MGEEAFKRLELKLGNWADRWGIEGCSGNNEKTDVFEHSNNPEIKL